MSIIVEGFVKVAQPEQHQGVRVGVLYFKVLAAYRRQCYPAGRVRKTQTHPSGFSAILSYTRRDNQGLLKPGHDPWNRDPVNQVNRQ